MPGQRHRDGAGRESGIRRRAQDPLARAPDHQDGAVLGPREQDGVLDPRSNLAGMHAEAVRLARLLDDLAELAEAERPGLLVEKTRADLGAVAGSAVDAFAARFAAASIALERSLEPAHVRGDADRRHAPHRTDTDHGAEARALEILHDACISPDRVNRQITGEEADLIWDERRLIIEIDGRRLITDPVLSERASPWQFMGPKRFHPVPVNVDAVLFWMVYDPEKAALEVQNYPAAVSWAAQTALRDIIGRTSLSDLLRGRERIEDELQQLIDDRSNPWGVTVQSVEMRDVVIPTALQDAMSREAQAARVQAQAPPNERHQRGARAGGGNRAQLGGSDAQPAVLWHDDAFRLSGCTSDAVRATRDAGSYLGTHARRGEAVQGRFTAVPLTR